MTDTEMAAEVEANDGPQGAWEEDGWLDDYMEGRITGYGDFDNCWDCWDDEEGEW